MRFLSIVVAALFVIQIATLAWFVTRAPAREIDCNSGFDGVAKSMNAIVDAIADQDPAFRARYLKHIMPDASQ